MSAMWHPVGPGQPLTPTNAPGHLTMPDSRGPRTPSLMVALMGMSGSSRLGGSSQERLGETNTVLSTLTVVRLYPAGDTCRWQPAGAPGPGDGGREGREGASSVWTGGVMVCRARWMVQMSEPDTGTHAVVQGSARVAPKSIPSELSRSAAAPSPPPCVAPWTCRQ